MYMPVSPHYNPLLILHLVTDTVKWQLLMCALLLIICLLVISLVVILVAGTTGKYYLLLNQYVVHRQHIHIPCTHTRARVHVFYARAHMRAHVEYIYSQRNFTWSTTTLQCVVVYYLVVKTWARGHYDI